MESCLSATFLFSGYLLRFASRPAEGRHLWIVRVYRSRVSWHHWGMDDTVFHLTGSMLASLDKTGEGHKYDHGHAVIVAGPAGQGGAARLAARGALRIGAGVVSVICDQKAMAEHAAQLTAIMVKTYDGQVAFGGRLTDVKPTAICIGPNLGLGNGSAAKLVAAMRAGHPLCLDADALTLIARDADGMAALVPEAVVMTPHAGELRRLIPETCAVSTCRVTLAQAAARKYGAVVLFKGVDTILARPDGAWQVVPSGRYSHAAWLATAGSGDVLAGFVTGLLARGYDPFAAAGVAADLHLRCAQAFGPGLIAEDLPEQLPRVLSASLAATGHP